MPSRKTALAYKFLLQIELVLASGWMLKDLWEALVHDGLDVNYETRPLLPSSRAPKSDLAHPRRTAEKALIGHPSRQKKTLTFFPLEVP